VDDGTIEELNRLCMTFNYHNKRFSPIQNSENGETSEETIFHYKQTGDVLTSEYSGGKILKGHLMAKLASDGSLDMRYHQINFKGELMGQRKYLGTRQII
jgi:hypothetical protein